MSSFAKRLTDRVEDYITLRQSLGYSFHKQASILRALSPILDFREFVHRA